MPTVKALLAHSGPIFHSYAVQMKTTCLCGFSDQDQISHKIKINVCLGCKSISSTVSLSVEQCSQMG